MIGLDTSILLRLLVWEPVDQAERARRFLDDKFENGERIWVSDLVVSEAYFALQYHYGIPKAEVLEALRSLFESGEILNIGVATEVLQTPNLSTVKPGFVDRMIDREYQRDGGAMVTFEKKAARLSETIVL